jgi:hypothetical protein
MLAMEGMDNLESIHLVDVYEGSIWGRRMRRSHIERAANAVIVASVPNSDGGDPSISPINLGTSSDPLDSERHLVELVHRIQKVVVCEVKTERFMGGDRAEEGSSVLI